MKPSRIRTAKRILASVVLVAAALLVVLEPAMGTTGSAPRAQAGSTVDLTCNLAFQFEFDRTSLRAARVAAAMGFCTSPNGSSPNLSAATVRAQVKISSVDSGVSYLGRARA